MDAATLTRDPFMPQAPRVRGRAIALAVLAHLLLILALAFGVNWRNDEPATVAAELWSATPQAAAPRAVEPPPPEPPPVQKVEPVAKPVPKPPEPVVAKPPTPTLPDPQIAIEKAKKEEAKRIAAEQEELKQEKREKAEREKRELALKKDKEREKADKLKAEQAKAEKLKAEQAKVEQAKSEKADKAEAARLAAIRDAQMKRMAGLAGATGGSTDTGTALRSSAPSANYAGRVMARIKPNILLTDPVDGNPRAVVEVKLAPDGTIIAKRLVQSSGVKVWDDAVLRAIERTEMLPLDNGRAPPVFEIGFRPRD
jgi:colicin import membrane protein